MKDISPLLKYRQHQIHLYTFIDKDTLKYLNIRISRSTSNHFIWLIGDEIFFLNKRM